MFTVIQSVIFFTASFKFLHMKSLMDENLCSGRMFCFKTFFFGLYAICHMECSSLFVWLDPLIVLFIYFH